MRQKETASPCSTIFSPRFGLSEGALVHPRRRRRAGARHRHRHRRLRGRRRRRPSRTALRRRRPRHRRRRARHAGGRHAGRRPHVGPDVPGLATPPDAVRAPGSGGQRVLPDPHVDGRAGGSRGAVGHVGVLPGPAYRARPRPGVRAGRRSPADGTASSSSATRTGSSSSAARPTSSAGRST